MLALSGALDNISVVVRQTLVQLRTPESLRGRVQAVNFLFIGSSNQLGEFESGATAAAFGPVASVVVGGMLTLCVVLSVAKLWPELKELGHLEREARCLGPPCPKPGLGPGCGVLAGGPARHGQL